MSQIYNMAIVDSSILLEDGANLTPPTSVPFDRHGLSAYSRAISTFVAFVATLGVTDYVMLAGNPGVWAFEVEAFRRVLEDQTLLGHSTLLSANAVTQHFNKAKFSSQLESIYAELAEAVIAGDDDTSDWHGKLVGVLDSEICGEQMSVSGPLSEIALEVLRRGLQGGVFEGRLFRDTLGSILKYVSLEDNGDVWCELLGSLEENGEYCINQCKCIQAIFADAFYRKL
jgi:hypothetical protein